MIGRPPRNGRGALVTPVFHREKIQEDSFTLNVMKPALVAADQVKSEVFGKAGRPIDHLRTQESPLGDIYTDAVRSATHADVALLNSGGIRANLEQGPITYGEIFRTLPFDNSLVVLTVSGAELRMILEIAESGSRGFPPVSGLSLKLIDPDSDAPSQDLNGDKKTEPWEIDRLLEVRMEDGSLLDDQKQYKLATLDFLASGGDDLAWAMKQIPRDHRQATELMVRDVAAQYIRQLSARDGDLNTAEHPAMDPEHPRFIFVKMKPAASGKKGRRHRRHRKHRNNDAQAPAFGLRFQNFS